MEFYGIFEFHGIFESYGIWRFQAILNFMDFQGIFEFHKNPWIFLISCIFGKFEFGLKLDFQNSVLQAFSLIQQIAKSNLKSKCRVDTLKYVGAVHTLKLLDCSAIYVEFPAMFGSPNPFRNPTMKITQQLNSIFLDLIIISLLKKSTVCHKSHWECELLVPNPKIPVDLKSELPVTTTILIRVDPCGNSLMSVPVSQSQTNFISKLLQMVRLCQCNNTVD